VEMRSIFRFDLWHHPAREPGGFDTHNGS
jgi:hypothetical protein